MFSGPASQASVYVGAAGVGEDAAAVVLDVESIAKNVELSLQLHWWLLSEGLGDKIVRQRQRRQRLRPVRGNCGGAGNGQFD